MTLSASSCCAQVGHEGVEALGDRRPQTAVQRGLPGMRVEAAVIAVEDPRAEIGEMHLGDALELAARSGVRDTARRLVVDRRHLQDVGALQRVQAGGAEVVHHAAALVGWYIWEKRSSTFCRCACS